MNTARDIECGASRDRSARMRDVRRIDGANDHAGGLGRYP
jgi:hypothetical protein